MTFPTTRVIVAGLALALLTGCGGPGGASGSTTSAPLHPTGAPDGRPAPFSRDHAAPDGNTASDGPAADAGAGTGGPSAVEAPPADRATVPPVAPEPVTPPATPDTPPGEEQEASRLSTFALDVDTASYGYARRTLMEGERPDPGRIRPEEFVNAFRQDYAEPPDDGFAVHLDGAHLAEPGTGLLRVGLRTRAVGAAARRPANLTFVVDVSGSMAEPGRLDLVRHALHTLVDRLGPGDRVGIVAFSDRARVLTPPTSAGSELHAAIDRLVVEGSTNLSAGLALGYEQAARSYQANVTNRVILLSDGLANTGETTWQAILDRVAANAGRRVTLLCVGVGREYGDELMEQLADNGDGAAVYVSTEDDAREVFAEHLTTTLEVRARDAKAQVVFDPAAVESYRLLGYENRALSAKQFRDDVEDGGEIGPGHSVTALYRVRLRPGATGHLATATVRWQDPDTRHPAEVSRDSEVAALAPALWRKAPARLQVSAVAADLAEHLRTPASGPATSPAHGPVTTPAAPLWPLAELGEHADRLAAETEDPAVTELAALIHKARTLD